MDVRTILTKLATKPASNILKVTNWMLSQAETHWAEETRKHQQAAKGYQGTNLGKKAEAAYQDAFDNWFTIRVLRQRLAEPVRLVGGERTQHVSRAGL